MKERTKAWQPLTFGGVARYAHDWLGKLFVTCLTVAIFVAVTVVWTIQRTWEPVVRGAISRLPDGSAEIKGGRLLARESVRLAENSFLSIALEPAGEVTSTSDLQVRLAPEELRFRSLFGIAAFKYPLHWKIPLRRAELQPWWEAWRPAFLGYLAAGTILFLFASWIALGIVYTLIPIILAGRSRRIGLWSSWKMCVAALMPGAIFQGMAMILYAGGRLRIEGILAAFALHFVFGWIFVTGAAFRLPKKEGNPFQREESAKNPFSSEEDSSEKGKESGADPPPHE